MTNLRTDAALLRALEQAAARPLSAEEIHRQQVSFIMGSLKDKSGITRARVEEILREQEGTKAR